MRRLIHVRVDGLFGYARHELSLRLSEPTIITAPNGAGKTHVLMIIKNALALNVAGLAVLPFANVRLQFDGGEMLEVQREITDGNGVLTFQLTRDGVFVEPPISIVAPPRAEPTRGLPSFLEQLTDGTWYDSRQGRVVASGYVERIYRVDLPPSAADYFKERPRLLTSMRETQPILIDTKRLDAPPHIASNEVEYARERAAAGAGSIGKYINRIRAEVTSARQESVRATQSSDLSFAARALAAANQRVYERALHDRYDQIVESYEQLSRNGLAVGEAPLAFPPKTTPTVRRILNVFLDDWGRRLQPLLPLNAKLETLRNILDTKLGESGKSTTIDHTGRLGFTTRAGKSIRVSSLSSGEQHLVALFTMLLFATRTGSIVLIDEPEISMHAAWKHAFLDDITRVAALNALQIVIATHSTAILNGRWDLEEALALTVPPDEISAEDDDVEQDDLFS